MKISHITVVLAGVEGGEARVDPHTSSQIHLEQLTTTQEIKL